MLKPSDNFTAKEIRFLQTEATEWIAMVNAKIIEAANNGDAKVRISIYDAVKKDDTEYYQAPYALRNHFEQRGFVVEPNGQTSIIIKWSPE